MLQLDDAAICLDKFDQDQLRSEVGQMAAREAEYENFGVSFRAMRVRVGGSSSAASSAPTNRDGAPGRRQRRSKPPPPPVIPSGDLTQQEVKK